MDNNIQVLLLADTPAEENDKVIQATAELLSAAKHDRLVAVVCTHKESNEEAIMLCIMYGNEETGVDQFIPVGKLFGPKDFSWVDYEPPEAALPQPGPLEGLGEEDESESEETA